MHTESDLMDIKIIEDPNPPKESDTIDLTNLDDEKEHNSGEQDKPKTNKKGTCGHKSTRKNEEDSAF